MHQATIVVSNSSGYNTPTGVGFLEDLEYSFFVKIKPCDPGQITAQGHG